MSEWNRRHLLAAAGLGGTAFLAGCSGGGGGGFPERDVNFLIPYAPGGGFDTYVRVVLGPMQRALPHKVNVVPTNVEGAGGGKAWSQAYHARPDGYTIVAVSMLGAIVLQLLQGTGGFDLEKMSWLGTMGHDAFAIAVGYNSPIKTLADMQALSKQRPIKFTSTGPGSTGRAGALIGSKLLDIRSEIIAGYKGTSEFLVAAGRGDGDAAVASIAAMQPLIRAKVIRIIASFEAKGTVPGVPDATQLGKPDLVNLAEIRSVAAPPGLPKDVQKTLADALHTSLKAPEVQDWAQKNGAAIVASSPEQTIQMLRQQTEFIKKWKGILGDKL